VPQCVPARRQGAAGPDDAAVSVTSHLIIFAVRRRRHRAVADAVTRHVGLSDSSGHDVDSQTGQHLDFRVVYVSGDDAGRAAACADDAKQGFRCTELRHEQQQLHRKRRKTSQPVAVKRRRQPVPPLQTATAAAAAAVGARWIQDVEPNGGEVAAVGVVPTAWSAVAQVGERRMRRGHAVGVVPVDTAGAELVRQV